MSKGNTVTAECVTGLEPSYLSFDEDGHPPTAKLPSGCFLRHFTLLLLLLRRTFVKVEEEFVPLCFGARHSPDVMVCNLCRVLVGSVGVVRLLSHLRFTWGGGVNAERCLATLMQS